MLCAQAEAKRQHDLCLIMVLFQFGGCKILEKLNDCIQNTTAVCNPRQNSVQISPRQNSVKDKIQEFFF